MIRRGREGEVVGKTLGIKVMGILVSYASIKVIEKGFRPLMITLV